MPWVTIQEAAERGPSRATWERRVAGGNVPSYVNQFGRRMVWVVEQDPTLLDLHQELRQLNAEVQEVLARLSHLGCDLPTRAAPAAAPLLRAA